mmetsp:Transcript_24137/g.62173  ORF Transcript_24137/g.62173 Transcript_24137/m.62173 type:complete len:450 (+) Transcript_24137:101-1450(+)
MRMRRNGFSWPPDPLQIGSWLLFSCFVVSFVTLVIFGLPRVASAVFAALYGVSALAVLVAAAVTTASDASDLNVLAACRPARVSGAPDARGSVAPACSPGSWMRKPAGSAASGGAERGGGEELNYCYICQIEVHKRSKHCKVCRKCVSVFDHHCVWLNNCIGAPNYRLFLATIWCTLVFLAVQVAGLLVVLAALLSDDEAVWRAVLWRFSARLAGVEGAEDHEGPGGVSTAADGAGGARARAGGAAQDVAAAPALERVPYASLVGAALFLSMPALLLVAQLCAFHIDLQRKGITTYDYIVQEQVRLNEQHGPSVLEAALANARALLRRKRSRASTTPYDDATTAAASSGGGDGPAATASASTPMGSSAQRYAVSSGGAGDTTKQGSAPPSHAGAGTGGAQSAGDAHAHESSPLEAAPRIESAAAGVSQTPPGAAGAPSAAAPERGPLAA